jgi:hypothetical protein
MEPWTIQGCAQDFWRHLAVAARERHVRHPCGGDEISAGYGPGEDAQAVTVCSFGSADEAARAWVFTGVMRPMQRRFLRLQVSGRGRNRKFQRRRGACFDVTQSRVVDGPQAGLHAVQLECSFQRRRPEQPHGHGLMNVARDQAADVAAIRRSGRTAEAGSNLNHGSIRGGHEPSYCASTMRRRRAPAWQGPLLPGSLQPPTLHTACTMWLDRIDPGSHRIAKGLRIVGAYILATGFAQLWRHIGFAPYGGSIAASAAGFALWACVSESGGTRRESCRNLTILCAAATAGAALFAMLSTLSPPASTHVGAEWILITGAFLVGYLKRFGTLGAGIGSQIFIGQLLAYGAKAGPADLGFIAIAGLIAVLAAVVPRIATGAATQRDAPSVIAASAGGQGLPEPPGLLMGIQTAGAAFAIVLLNAWFGLTESAWAITACVYVVTGTASGTMDRARQRIIGTFVGVPLGLLCLPVAIEAPYLIWLSATAAMIVYTIALPKHYDIACGAFAFALIVTLEASGQHAVAILASRAWETLIGAALGMVMAKLVMASRHCARAKRMKRARSIRLRLT